jgi:Flp pilus assembly protein TadG
MNQNYSSLGQDLIEYALMLPFMFLAIVFIFDLGLGIFYYSSLNLASREGARFGVVNPCDDGGVISNVAARAIALNLDSNTNDESNDDIDVDWFPEDCSTPDDPGTSTVTVSVDYEYQPFSEYIITIFGGSAPYTMNSTTTMHLEQ